MAEMTLDEVKAVAMRYFDERSRRAGRGVRRPAVHRRHRLLRPGDRPGQWRGEAVEVKQFFSIFFKVFPDVHFEINDFFAEGEQGRDQVHLDRDPQDGVPRDEAGAARGRTSDRHLHIRDGKIAEVRVALDRGHLLQQLGGIHPRSEARRRRCRTRSASPSAVRSHPNGSGSSSGSSPRWRRIRGASRSSRSSDLPRTRFALDRGPRPRVGRKDTATLLMTLDSDASPGDRLRDLVDLASHGGGQLFGACTDYPDNPTDLSRDSVPARPP